MVGIQKAKNKSTSQVGSPDFPVKKGVSKGLASSQMVGTEREVTSPILKPSKEDDSFRTYSDENDPLSKSGSSQAPYIRQGSQSMVDQIQNSQKRAKRKGTLRGMQDRKTELLSNDAFKAQLQESKVEQPGNAIETRLLLYQKEEELASEERKTYMLYPEDKFKHIWDVFVTFVLIFTCMVIPVRIAFATEDTTFWVYVNLFIDLSFVIDIILSFNTAVYDSSMQIIDDKKEIARIYLRTWFLIDLVGVIPFDQLSKLTGSSEVGRYAKLSRMYKLTKLTRLVRVMKLFKKQKKMFQPAQDVLKVSAGLERLFGFFMSFFLICHIVGCLWIMIGYLLIDDNSETWLDSYQHLTDTEIYLTSVYYTVTTITTVGYGDISASDTITEKVFCILVMVAGVLAFSFASGSLASIIQNIDNQNAKLADQVTILNRIYQEYKLPVDLYQRLKISLQHNSSEEIDHLNQFLEELPHNLKIETSLYIHKDTYNTVHFMKDKSMSLIAWLCPLLKSYLATPQEYLYSEGDEIMNMYFMKKGSCGYVLPKYDNTRYINITKGCDFGTEDIIACILRSEDVDSEDWIQQKEKLIRHFTVMSEKQTELLLFSINDVNRMQAEFLEAYNKLMDVACRRLEYALSIKGDCIKKCEEIQKMEKIGEKAPILHKDTIRRTKANSYNFKPFSLAQLDQNDLEDTIIFIPSDEDEFRAQFLDAPGDEAQPKIGDIQEVHSKLEQSSSSSSIIDDANGTILRSKKNSVIEETKLGDTTPPLLLQLMGKREANNTPSVGESSGNAGGKAQDIWSRLAAANQPPPRPSSQTQQTQEPQFAEEKTSKLASMFGKHLKKKLQDSTPVKGQGGSSSAPKKEANPELERLLLDLSDKIERLGEDNSRKFDSLKEDHNRKLDQLKAAQAKKIDSIKKANAESMQELTDTHARKIASLEQKIDDMRFQSINASSSPPKPHIDYHDEIEQPQKLFHPPPTMMAPQMYFQMMGFNPFQHFMPRSNYQSPPNGVFSPISFGSNVQFSQQDPVTYNARIFSPPNQEMPSPLHSPTASSVNRVSTQMPSVNQQTVGDHTSFGMLTQDQRQYERYSLKQNSVEAGMFDSFPRDPSMSRARASQEEMLICASSGFGEPQVPPTSGTDHRHNSSVLKDSKARYLREIFESTNEPANQVVIADDSSDNTSRELIPRKTTTSKPRKDMMTQEEERLPEQISLHSSQFSGDIQLNSISQKDDEELKIDTKES